MGAVAESPRINKSLITLKIVVFFVIAGITALHILHSTKPYLLGLRFDEYRTLCIIAPFVSILGPLVVGPLADRLAAKNPSNFGRILRILTAVCLIIAAIIYACLFAVPKNQQNISLYPRVSFACDDSGAYIFQEKCNQNATCYNWHNRAGSLNLTKCAYTCFDPVEYEDLYVPWTEYEPTPLPSTEHSSEASDYGDDVVATTESLRSKRAAEAAAEASYELLSAEDQQQQQHQRSARAIKSTPNKVYVEPPHLCMTETDENGNQKVKNCHVYSKDSTNVLVHSSAQAAISADDASNHLDITDDWCTYPFENFVCNIPQKQKDFMISRKNPNQCRPIVECLVTAPYDSRDSVMEGTECYTVLGDPDKTYTNYAIIRILGDIFPMAALTLLNTAIVLAVRETSEGRGEVCRQYVWGAIGYVLLFSPLDLVFFDQDMQDDAALVSLILVIVCFVLAALVLVVATQMPLSPPEWWWHTKTGIMVYPMSAIRRYSPEMVVVTVVAILFGTFWSSIHSYLRWVFTDSYAVTFSGLLLVFVLFFNVDKFIEYCGHSNIFIGGFALFIIRFTALTDKDAEWLTITMEVLEPTIIGIVWITIILYMRHIMPRKLTATGQAIGVLAFFGIGKGCGALIGLARDHKEPALGAEEIHQWLAVACCFIALFYFVLYNLILAPRCTAPPQHHDELMSGSASQNFSNGAGGNAGTAGNAGSAGAALNGNGNYSPLRVYHNERGKKGQFRF